MKKDPALLFIGLALIALVAGVMFGCVAGIQFLVPEFLKELPFVRIRPLHVSFVVAWIFLAAMGGIYYYLPRFCGADAMQARSIRLHFILFLATGLVIAGCYIAGRFGGREYWEYPPWLSVPVLITWMIFGFLFFRSVFRRPGSWPVYLWMWSTGIVFFFFTFTEAHLWLLPYFRDNLVRDLTVQWKAYGALVGSWNMLVYGTAIFLMGRIAGDDRYAHSRLAFGMYFLGFANLLFGWAHHIYIIPSALWVRMLSYAMSMTEWIILIRIIWNWRGSLSEGRRNAHILSYRFLLSADVWVFLNLFLALLISIPAVNIYTHGTHITVAHAMGSTIGINTMILLASCTWLISHATGNSAPGTGWRAGFWIMNISLVVFWTALIVAGTIKGIRVVEGKLPFALIMQEMEPVLWIFSAAGIFLFLGVLAVVVPLLNQLRRVL